MIDSLARGKTKDLIGPVTLKAPGETVGQKIDGALFRFVDTWSVLGWGRMQDSIPHRGYCMATVDSFFHSRIKDISAWSMFFRSPDSMAMRKGVASISSGDSGALFNKIATQISAQGVHSHHLGLVSDDDFQKAGHQDLLQIGGRPGQSRISAIEWQNFERPVVRNILGRNFKDYSVSAKTAYPKVLPFSFRVYFEVAPGSSLLQRSEKNPDQLAHLALSKTASFASIREGMSWDFPVMEIVGCDDPYQRPWSFQETSAVTGLSPDDLQTLFLNAAWVAGLIRYECRKVSLSLAECSLRFGMNSKGEFTLADSLSLDDLSLRYNNEWVTSQLLMPSISKTVWIDAFERSKQQSLHAGLIEYRKNCFETAPFLPTKIKNSFQVVTEFITQELCSIASSDALPWKHDRKTFEEALGECHVRSS